MINGTQYRGCLLSMVALVILASSTCYADQRIQAQPLKPKQGYLLVNLDVNGVAPSIYISRLKGQKYTRKTHVQTIQLKDAAMGFKLLTLDEGNYQIVQVNVPYFDLPYQLDTSDDILWRFSVVAGKVNYLGKLFIDGSRSVGAVNVHLLNRVAADYGSIQAEFPVLLENYSLRQAAFYPDGFLMMLEISSDEK